MYPAAAGRVAWINVAPVKGLALEQREQVRLERDGVHEDRRLHLIDAKGRLVNGKRLGRLFQVHAELDGARLRLRFPGGSSVEAEIELGERLQTSFYSRPVDGRLVEGPFSQALSDFMGEPLRLAAPDDPGDGVDRGARGPVTLLSVAALDTLDEQPLDGRRFRMTFGIDGVEAHAEDGWIGREVRIGEAVVVPRGNVGRCLVTSRDPETGRPDVDTLGALRRLRGDLDTTEPLPFGVYAEVSTPGPVRLNDPVEPL